MTMIKEGKKKIPFNIVHTNNCAGHYKCCQTFFQTGASCDTRDTTIVQKLVQKYGFKRRWDATGRHVKGAINWLELKNERIANANDFYLKLGKELTRDGSGKKHSNCMSLKEQEIKEY
eukprot:7185067-Ditylum_brightwellii.AAC.1